MNEKDDIIIYKEFYKNIRLKYQNIINQLLKEILNLKTNSLNYDFFNNKYFNNYLVDENINKESFINDFTPIPNDGLFFIIFHCAFLGFGGKSFIVVCKSFAGSSKLIISIINLSYRQKLIIYF